jgi:hypothetical protein
MLRDKFNADTLLLASYRSLSSYAWASPANVFLECPSFIRSTLSQIPTKSRSYKSICKFLELPTWSTANLLESELTATFSKLKMSYSMWQGYLYNALKFVVGENKYISAAGPKEWLTAILELPVFPVLDKSGTKRYSKLQASVTVPDSFLFLGALQGQLDLLDFGDLPLDILVPLLKCAPHPPTFLSEHESHENVSMVLVEPIISDTFHTRLVMRKIDALAR